MSARLELMLVFLCARYFGISLVKKVFWYYADYKIGESISVKGNDLTSWDVMYMMQDWVSVHNKNAEISINGNSVFHFKYVKNFGDCWNNIHIWRLGSVDFISVSDGNGKIVYRDDLIKHKKINWQFYPNSQTYIFHLTKISKKVNIEIIENELSIQNTDCQIILWW